jgi:hypothetical protein
MRQPVHEVTMSDEITRLLRSPDPAQRRQGIMRLADARSPAALPLLADIYRSDPVPELRELALKAGRYIRGPAGAAPTAAGTSAVAPAPGRSQAVSKRDAELARIHLDAAINFHAHGDPARAVENLGKAISLNPALEKETLFANLTLSVMGLPVASALPILVHPDRRAEFMAQVGGKRKLKRKQAHGKGAEKATWDNVLIDFILFAVVLALVTMAFLVFSLDAIEEAFEASATSVTADQLDTFYSASMAFLIVFAIFSAVISAFSLAIQGLAIHFAATTFFGGDGTLAYLYRRMVPFQTVIALGTSAAIIALTLFGSTGTLLLLIPLAMTVGTVVYYYVLSSLIGEVYNFGAGSGCGALLIGGILLAALSVGGQIVLVSLLNRLMA